MRKDAKIGFAIGGVLLAVLTVYVLVVPSHKNSGSHSGVTLATGSGAPGASGDLAVSVPPVEAAETTTSTAAKSDTTGKPADAKPEVARNDGVNWEKILGGTGDAPTLKTSTPAPTDAPAEVAVNTPSPAANTAEIPLAAVAPVSAAPAVAMAPSTQPTGMRNYVIKPGQTLSIIAAEIYGNSRFYVAIKRANPSIDPNHLKPGMKIMLPDISDVKPDPARDAVRLTRQNSPGSSTGKTYTVQSGDTLYRISKNLYGSGKQADLIYELNKDSIGADKSRLRLGMVLRLPAVASAAVAVSTR